MVSVFKGSANFAELLGERMQFQTIASRKNERVQAFCRLRDAAAERKKTGLFVLEGLRVRGLRRKRAYDRKRILHRSGKG